MEAPAPMWQLDGDVANLACGPLSGRVEADGRGVRFTVATWLGELSDAFGVLITAGPGPRPAVLEVAERYARGADYVATYARSAEYPVAPQFYWRATHHSAASAVQIEMYMSVQTDLLDSHPEATVSSFALASRLFWAPSLGGQNFQEVAAAEIATVIDPGQSREHLFVFRCEGLGLSYAQMVHPSDFVGAQIQARPAGPQVVTATLFPESLEKGVIRRGRISGWFLPAENDLETALALARQFMEEPLPLTA